MLTPHQARGGPMRYVYSALMSGAVLKASPRMGAPMTRVPGWNRARADGAVSLGRVASRYARPLAGGGETNWNMIVVSPTTTLPRPASLTGTERAP